jgi:hypothetical protein
MVMIRGKSIFDLCSDGAHDPFPNDWEEAEQKYAAKIFSLAPRT